LLIVYLGEGEGRTYASVGLLFRAMGRGLKVCVIKFTPESWEYNLLISCEQFRDILQFHDLAEDCQWQSGNTQQDMSKAGEAWQFAMDIIESGRFEMVLLHGLTYLMHSELVDTKETVNFLSNLSKNLHVVVTGPEAPGFLVEAADLVTEMKCITHQKEFHSE